MKNRFQWGPGDIEASEPLAYSVGLDRILKKHGYSRVRVIRILSWQPDHEYYDHVCDEYTKGTHVVRVMENRHVEGRHTKKELLT